MTLNQARFSHGSICGASAIICIFLLKLAPRFRPGIIAPSDANEATFKLLALCIPILGAYLACAYNPVLTKRRKTTPKPIQVPGWTVIIAILTAIAYFSVVIFFIVDACYLESYAAQDPDSQMPFQTFDDSIGWILKFGLFTSFVITYPAACFAGVGKLEIGNSQ
jgi:hypothetical protein